MRETVFHRLLEFSVRHACFIVIGACLVTGVFGYFMTKVRVDPDVASVIPKREKYTLLMEKYGEMDEEEDYLVLALESKDSYTPADLALLEEVVNRIEQLPKAKPSITPFTMVTFERNGRKLEVLPIAPGGRAPETASEMEAFKKRLLRDPFARRFLVSSDGEILCVFIPTGAIENYSVFMEQFKEYIAVLNDRFNIYYSGSLAFIYVMQKYLTSDLSKLISIALLVILFIYYIGFRTKRSVLLTFMVVVMGTIWTIGFMSLLGYAITVISIVTPPLILSLGSSYSIHMLNQYYRESGGVNGKIKDNGDASGRGWVTDAAAHINRTIVLASITTVIGFCSLLVTTLEKTREFSISASFGIISCAILSLFMLPAILYHMKPPTEQQREKILEGALSRFMERAGKAILKWRVLVLVFLVTITVGYVISLRYLKHETDIISYFPKKERVVRDTRFITVNVGGFQELKITLSAPDGEKNYFLRQDVLEQISRLEEKLKTNRNISNLFSFVSYLKFANEIMFDEYKVPDKKGLILLLSRYVKLLRARSVSNEIIRSLANDEFSLVTITLWIFDSNRMNLISDLPLRDLKEDIEGYIRETLDPAL